MYLKLSSTLLKLPLANNKLPDVIGAIARAQNSGAAVKAKNEVAGIGELVCNSNAAEIVEPGLHKYGSIVTQLDIKLLEQVREEICFAMDAFDSVESKSKIDNHVCYPL
jgi:hypothetical protein